MIYMILNSWSGTSLPPVTVLFSWENDIFKAINFVIYQKYLEAKILEKA